MADERYYNTDEQRDQGEAEWAEDLGTDRDNTNYAQDTAETVYISSLALLKMLKHGRAELPKEAVGLMLGDFLDEFTVNVVDVFPMPPGTGVSVEAFGIPDPVPEGSVRPPCYPLDMIDKLKETGRLETVVGWYHSHIGTGCWMTDADENTQKSFEALNARTVAVVIVSIESVKGQVVMDAYRTIYFNYAHTRLGTPRTTTSNLGHLADPTFMPALHHGLNHRYYSIRIDHKFQENELEMLLKVYKTLRLDLPQSIRLKREKMEKERRASSFSARAEQNKTAMQNVLKRVGDCNKALEEAEQNPMTRQQRAIKYFGKQDPLRHIKEEIAEMMWDNIEQLADAIWPNKDIAFVPQKQEEQNPPAVYLPPFFWFFALSFIVDITHNYM